MQLKWLFPALLILLPLVFQCAKPKEYKFQEVQNVKKWGIYPGSTVLGKRSQFVITGKNLFSCEIITGSSVTVEKKEVSADGNTLKFYMSIDTLDAIDPVDKPGARQIQVRTLEAMENLSVKILDEAQKGSSPSSPLAPAEGEP